MLVSVIPWEPLVRWEENNCGLLMKPYYDHNGITIFHGNNLEVMSYLPENYIDSVLTDPPYGLKFMCKGKK